MSEGTDNKIIFYMGRKKKETSPTIPEIVIEKNPDSENIEVTVGDDYESFE